MMPRLLLDHKFFTGYEENMKEKNDKFDVWLNSDSSSKVLLSGSQQLVAKSHNFHTESGCSLD